MCFPFVVAVALPTFTSQNVRLKGDLVAGRRHVALFSLCSPARLSTGGFLRSFLFFRSNCVVTGASTERGTKAAPHRHAHRQIRTHQFAKPCGVVVFVAYARRARSLGRHIESGHACSPKGTPHQHGLVLTEPSPSSPATHTRALAPGRCPRRTKPRLKHAHSRTTPSLFCHMHRVECFSRGGPLLQRRQRLTHHWMAGRPPKHSSCWLHIRHEKDSHGGRLLLGTNLCARPCACHFSQEEPDRRDDAGRDCPKCRSTLQKQAQRWNLGSAELDQKQVPDRQKFCALHAGVYMRTLRRMRDTAFELFCEVQLYQSVDM